MQSFVARLTDSCKFLVTPSKRKMSLLQPKAGRYYFDAHDTALVNAFKTLGIKSLRVGANAVDDPHIPVPQEKDIDELFNFARAAGVKVIYSFRLKNGNPAGSARLAAYIAARERKADWEVGAPAKCL